MTHDDPKPAEQDGLPTPSPAGPWWSVPEDTAGAPAAGAGSAPVAPPGVGPRAGADDVRVSSKPGPFRAGRRRTAALLAAALVAGGTAGGGVGALVVNSGDASTGSVAATGTVNRTDSTVATSSAGSTVTGTPETAAAVIGPSVVTIEVSGTQSVTSNDFFGGGGQTQSQSVSDTGSGVVLRSDGYILTNNHVVSAAENGGSVHVTFSNGKTVAATIVGHDATSDLAVIKVAVSGLRAATFANSNSIKVGQSVLAIGAPLGLSNSVTEGIVSTLHRPVATGESGASAQSVIDAVQTDAAINPGNSGGALVDLAGRVVGINSAIATTGSDSGSTSQSGNIGVGFAIPSNDAAKVANSLIATGHATHAQIGISVTDASSSTDGAPGLGAGVRSITAGGPAAKAGLRAGDVITKVGTRLVTDANSLIVAVRAYDPGTTVAISYTRSGENRTATVALGKVTA